MGDFRFAVVSLFVSSAALAASETTIAVHPLAVVGVSAAESEEFSAAFASELAKLDLDLADGAAVRSFVEKKNGSCAGDEACLAELAKATSAGSSLWVTLAPFSPKLVVSAKLIRADGSTARSVGGLEFEKAQKAPTQDDVRNAFKKLFATLRLTSPELVSLVEEPSQNNTTANSSVTSNPSTEVTASGRTTRSTIGMSLGAAGVAGLALGAVFAMQAQASWDSFEQIYQGGSFPDSSRAELISIRDRARSQQTTAAIAAGAGALLAGAGVYLYLTDSSGPATAAVSASPSGVLVFGAF